MAKTAQREWSQVGDVGPLVCKTGSLHVGGKEEGKRERISLLKGTWSSRQRSGTSTQCPDSHENDNQCPTFPPPRLPPPIFLLDSELPEEHFSGQAVGGLMKCWLPSSLFPLQAVRNGSLTSPPESRPKAPSDPTGERLTAHLDAAENTRQILTLTTPVRAWH